jgi:hypothetical protein
MNLPISWVVAGAIPVSQAIRQASSLGVTSASHFFGDLLQSNRPSSSLLIAGNGRSELVEKSQSPKALSERESWSDRVESVRSYLSKVLDESKARAGLPNNFDSSDRIAILSSGKGDPIVKGVEPLRSEVERFLRDHPKLVQEINDLALERAPAGPLQWLPKRDDTNHTDEPWTLWLDG